MSVRLLHDNFSYESALSLVKGKPDTFQLGKYL